MTKLPIVTWSAIVLVTLSSFSRATAQESKADKIDDKTFAAFVSKHKDWKVDSAWGRVKKDDQVNYHFSPLASMSISSNKKFDAVDQKGVHAKGKWTRDSRPENEILPSIGFDAKTGTRWFLSDYEVTGAKPYLILESDVCNDACRVWYRLRPK